MWCVSLLLFLRDHVLLVLPQDDSPVLTRELLYTGITRAKQQLTLATTQTQLTTCPVSYTHLRAHET